MNAETQNSSTAGPVGRRASPVPSLAEVLQVLAGLEPLDADLPEIDDPPTEPENPI